MIHKKGYLATMDHNSTHPINRGLVDLADNGFITIDGEETPIEDFGCYAFDAMVPFPPTGSDALFEFFLNLIKQVD